MEKLQPEGKVRKITEAFIKSRGMSVVLPDISDLGSGIADIAAKDGECLVLVRIEARFGYDPAPPPPFSLNRRGYTRLCRCSNRTRTSPPSRR